MEGSDSIAAGVNLDRRTFLRLAGFATLAGVAAACPKREKPAPVAAGSLEALSRGKTNTLTVVNPQPSLPRPRDRFALALLSPDNTTLYKGGTARAWVARSQKESATGPIELTWHGEGLERGVYVGHADFAAEGKWFAYVEARPEGSSDPLYGGLQFQVGRPAPQPIPGEKAPSVPTPTVDNHRGVDPICTRTPMCSLHRLSLDAALRDAKPTVLIIGTPRFCQSRICGPVLDIVEGVAKGALGKRVNFVHIEQYANDGDAVAKQLLSPGAQAYKLELEPVVYYISRGTITEWTIGPSDAPEVQALTQSLLA
jgi:hypothetical protein